jgi:hypothetical protein
LKVSPCSVIYLFEFELNRVHEQCIVSLFSYHGFDLIISLNDLFYFQFKIMV